MRQPIGTRPERGSTAAKGSKSRSSPQNLGDQGPPKSSRSGPPRDAALLPPTPPPSRPRLGCSAPPSGPPTVRIIPGSGPRRCENSSTGPVRPASGREQRRPRYGQYKTGPSGLPGGPSKWDAQKRKLQALRREGDGQPEHDAPRQRLGDGKFFWAPPQDYGEGRLCRGFPTEKGAAGAAPAAAPVFRNPACRRSCKEGRSSSRRPMTAANPTKPTPAGSTVANADRRPPPSFEAAGRRPIAPSEPDHHGGRVRSVAMGQSHPQGAGNGPCYLGDRPRKRRTARSGRETFDFPRSGSSRRATGSDGPCPRSSTFDRRGVHRLLTGKPRLYEAGLSLSPGQTSPKAFQAGLMGDVRRRCIFSPGVRPDG